MVESGLGQEGIDKKRGASVQRTKGGAEFLYYMGKECSRTVFNASLFNPRK